MTAIPIRRAAGAIAGAADAAAVEADFDRRLSRLARRYAALWETTPAEPPVLGSRVSRLRQLANARSARRLIDRLAAEIERFPRREEERAAWRRRVEERVRAFGEDRLGWPAAYRRLLFADAFFVSSVEFVRRARAFARELGASEIGQALRNVWIMNSLQMLLERPVELTPAMFAYSMLYPETDNYLDDPAVAGAAKRRFNRVLELRLRGGRERGEDPRQRRVCRLLDEIDAQWPRAEHPEAHLALLAIQRAQEASLSQDGSRGPSLDAAALLRLSVAKGGASVLADGYLVKGRLSRAEEDFCFGYGVFLQLLDDLQDREPDRRDRHATLFSTAPAGPELERQTARLHRFVSRVVAGAGWLAAPRHAATRDLIERNCNQLLVGAVADQRRGYSTAFRRHLERRWPLRFAAMRRLRRRADRRFRRAGEAVRRRQGAGSVMDLL